MHGMVVIDEVVRSLATVDGSLEKKKIISVQENKLNYHKQHLQNTILCVHRKRYKGK